MKSLVDSKRFFYLSAAAIGLWLVGAAPSRAAIVTPDPSDLQSGITYEWKVVMNDTDFTHFHGSVGAKSWAEPAQPVGQKGWTHTTDWAALDLSGVSGPTFLTLELERGHTGSLFPSVTLFQGWETVNSDANNHTFHNTGNIGWATNLTYLDHVANAGGPNGTDNGTPVESFSRQWALAPGLYTLNFGGNPAFSLGQTGQHAFSATLYTSPVPVPAAVYLFGSGLIGLAGLARRRMTA